MSTVVLPRLSPTAEEEPQSHDVKKRINCYVHVLALEDVSRKNIDR